MAILTESFNGFSGSTLNTPSELPNITDYDHDKFGLQRALAEAYSDMVGIVESIAVYDVMGLNMIKEASENGVTVESLVPVYETGMVDKAKEIFAKIKKFLQDLWAKVKQFFKTAVAFVLSLFMKGKEFVKKYKSELDKNASKTVELQRGFKYENLESVKAPKDAKAQAKSAVEDISKTFKDVLKIGKDASAEEIEKFEEEFNEEMRQYKEDKDDALDEIRGGFVGESRVSADRFAEKLFAFFRSGKNDYGQVKWTVSEAVKILESDYSKPLKDAESEVNSMFNDVLAEIKKYETVSDKVHEKVKSAVITGAREASSFFTAVQSITGTALKAKKDAISSAEVMAKKVCLVAIAGKASDDK